MSGQTRAWFVGEGTLLVRCAEIYLNAGHLVAGIASQDPALKRWADDRHIPVSSPSADLAAAMREHSFEYLFSIGNLMMLPGAVISAPERAAVNFHYGPLPAYAGVNVPIWALLNGERHYGITWHEMTTGVDAGRILLQTTFDLPDSETAAGITARCFEAGVRTFGTLIEELVHERVTFTPQDFSKRSVFRRHDRPRGHAIIDWSQPADAIARLVRALDFGPLENSFAVPRLLTSRGALIVTAAEVAPAGSSPAPHLPGTILHLDGDHLVVASGSSPLDVRGVRRLTGERLSIVDAATEHGWTVGAVLPSLRPYEREAIDSALTAATRGEADWIKALADLSPVAIPHASERPDVTSGHGPRERSAIEMSATQLDELGRAAGAERGTVLLTLAAVYLTRVAGATAATLPLMTDALAPQPAEPGRALLSDCVPVRVDVSRSWAEQCRVLDDRRLDASGRGSFLVDACARYPDRLGLASFGRWRRHALLCLTHHEDRAQDADLALIAAPGSSRLIWDVSATVYTVGAVAKMQREFLALVADLVAHPDLPLAGVSLLDAHERARVLDEWNRTDRAVEPVCVHALFEAQMRRTPDVRAVVFRDRSLTYRDLNRHANHVARQLRDAGIGPDQVVGVFVDRSLEMVVALLGILKAGGAYLPLDPAFPQERLTWMLEDTGAPVVLTQGHLIEALPRHQARVMTVDLSATPPGDTADVSGGARPEHLAYVIFTSGSTGRPKGVMVEHRQAANFFVGMDEYLGGRPAGTWLAVTSISFDISVLELFWTLARGFTVVVQEELVKAAGSGSTEMTDDRSMDFSLFYFSADARGDGGNRYRLLLEGAKYADAHDFRGVWTPERHFHEFGGLYPNPAVTSAAIATITSRVRVRAGSVVLPLHHPIRVAEEWAVVDHLSEGRVELSFASGWHANDFALAPQNYKDRRDVMLSGIDTIRRLWRGEAVAATNGHGEPIEVKVYPAPLQPKPAFWIAAAGNVDTFRMAGTIGAHLLTNLLGQKVDEVATKIAAYRAAWREAGHPGDGVVALMLHTFVGPNLDDVRDTVRRPLIEYLKTATELVKKTRWEFPAFANPSGKQAPTGDVDLSAEDVDAMMSHAFERYFETSGLFGTPEICLRRVQELKAVGVDEIACLLDFGIATDTVLAHLPYLNDVRERSRPRHTTEGDYTIATQVVRHNVTHLQGTPSLIRTILADERGHSALARLDALLVGGEPLPPALATELLGVLKGQLLNMYGPTETTVWSTVARITDGGDVTIGRPIANTQIYVVDPAGQPQPVGVAGELLIGGFGVTRGYWRRPDLTLERFVANPCLPARQDLVYRTGDLARYRPDGRLECLGRVDHQVKVSGHRIELGEIEAALESHPSTGQAVVIVKPDASGESRLVAYVVPRTGASVEDNGAVTRWQAVWDETYGGIDRATPVDDPTFDISGWRNSYTGELMSESDMREWVQATVDRVLALKPARILEIGCGTGLLLHRLAPLVEHYSALDFSPTAVARVQAQVTALGLANVTLRAAAADTLATHTDLLPVDVVIINSVAQYFPDEEYLVRVLQQATAHVRPGGAVFVGDVRSLPLLEAFHTSVELAQAPAGMATSEFRQRVRERVQNDPELVVAPALFDALGSQLPAVSDVDIELKPGRAHNEMTCFRYDVVLHVGGAAATATGAEVDGSGFTLREVGAALSSAPDGVTIRGLRNPRVTHALDALRVLGSADCPDTVAGLQHAIGTDRSGGIEPDDLRTAADGWCVHVRWAASGTLEDYDAVFTRPGVVAGPAVGRRDVAVRPWREYVHRPMADRGQLVQTLKQHLRSRLPAYMVPGIFVLLDAFPLTPNGKIDRKSLPEPDRQRQEAASSYVAPVSDIERTIAETWQDLLALDRVGLHDNVFDIGANSLLMVQAHASLREKLGRPLSLVDLFRFPTVSTLAAFLGQSGTPAPSAALTASEARAQARMDALGRRRQGRSSPRTPAPGESQTP